jgi:hypothetical protein
VTCVHDRLSPFDKLRVTAQVVAACAAAFVGTAFAAALVVTARVVMARV